ncbi:hypothetical protein AZE42_13601, partial [Rhizopogon vesiculosus]
MPLEPLQIHAALSIPYLYASPPHIVGPSSLATYSPSYPASSTSVSPALVDPLDIWDVFSHNDSAAKPLKKIAQHILSICPNSASCERLFSIFDPILTKWRNRLSTENLMLLAELKMCLHEERLRAGSVKKHLKRRYCDGPNNDPEVNQPSGASHTVDDSEDGVHAS